MMPRGLGYGYILAPFWGFIYPLLVTFIQSYM